jgi:hypothetical protein
MRLIHSPGPKLMLCVVYKGDQLVQQQADPPQEDHREGTGRGEHVCGQGCVGGRVP